MIEGIISFSRMTVKHLNRLHKQRIFLHLFICMHQPITPFIVRLSPLEHAIQLKQYFFIFFPLIFHLLCGFDK